MHRDLVQKLSCPARDCGGETLLLEIDQVETLSYTTGEMEEVREGALHCPACNRSYPIHEYVPSFAALFPSDLVEEADFWSKWYGLLWQRGYMGFFDLRAPVAPCLLQGIDLPAPGSAGVREMGGMHVELADHPDVRAAD